MHHPRLRRNRHLVRDPQVTRHPHLTRDRHVITDLRAASDSHLRHQNTVLPDSHIVGDLNQVIDLGTTADHRGPESRPIDRHIRTDFNVIMDDHLPHLRHLAVLTLVEHIAEAIRTNHRARMNTHTPPQRTAWVERHIRIKPAPITHDTVLRDEIATNEDRLSPDPDPFTDDALRPYMRRRIHLCRSCHHRRHMDPCRQNRLGEKQRQHLSKGYPRILDLQNSFAGRRPKITGHQNG